jgi:hypothetical protein
MSVQAMHLKNHFPDSRVRVRKATLEWIAKLVPTECSETYTVRLVCKQDDYPRVHVIEPELVAPEGKDLPHVYTEDRLCLYYPGEWQRTEILAVTVIPWISEWLFHYEIWRATGEWCGGGVHPSSKNLN